MRLVNYHLGDKWELEYAIWLQKLMRNKNISNPQSLLLDYISQIFPGQKIVEEFYLPGKLRLDIFLPSLGIAVEYHGQQHFQFIKHFHQTPEKFQEALLRDREKHTICKQLNIRLVIFRYGDEITLDTVREKLKVKTYIHYDESEVTEKEEFIIRPKLSSEQKAKAKKWRKEQYDKYKNKSDY